MINVVFHSNKSDTSVIVQAERNIWRPNADVTGGAAPPPGALQRDELPAAALHLHPGPQVSGN